MKRNHTAPTKRTQITMHMHISFMNSGESKKKKLRLDQFAQISMPILVFAIGTWFKSFFHLMRIISVLVGRKNFALKFWLMRSSDIRSTLAYN